MGLTQTFRGPHVRAMTFRSFEKVFPGYFHLLAVSLSAILLLSILATPCHALDLVVDSLSDNAESGTDGICLTLVDAGVYGCTLREALQEIEAVAAGSHNITFEPALVGAIQLGSSLPTISRNLSILGNGSDVVIIDGQNTFGIFSFANGSPGQAFSIQDLGLFRGYRSSGGGAVYIGSDVYGNLFRTVFEENSAPFWGGAVYCDGCGGVWVTQSRFSRNTASSGGGAVHARNAGDVSLESCLLTENGIDNINGGLGGGIFVDVAQSLTITDTVFEANAAFQGSGGALAFRDVGVASISGSSFNGNGARDWGGGIFMASTAVASIHGITVVGNTTVDKGGGIGVFGTGEYAITNGTISGNRAEQGGGIYDGTGTLRLANVTISGNVANANGDAIGSGGGVYGSVTLQNSVIAGNTVLSPGSPPLTPDCFGTITSNGYNLIGDATGCSLVGGLGDQTGTSASLLNPMLGPLAWNGGPTRTHALLVGSPAIESGNGAGCTWDHDADAGTAETLLPEDQRTEIRPYDADGTGGPQCDIGAFEWTHCDNGILDTGAGETDVDCGGSCAACACPGTAVDVTGTSFGSIQLAYNNQWDGALLKIVNLIETWEDLVFDRPIHTHLLGGHDCEFFRIRGLTKIASLTVEAGRVVVENIEIGP